MKLMIYADGACSGNPGTMGIGIIIFSKGRVVRRISRNVGFGTNNTAEYLAVIEALKEAQHLGADDILIISDSRLLVNQLSGKYKIKSSKLRGLAEIVSTLSKKFRRVCFEWSAREENSYADKLAKMAIGKKRMKKA